LPKIEGSPVFFGAFELELAIAAVGFEATVRDWTAFVALTRSRIRFPRSAF